MTRQANWQGSHWIRPEKRLAIYLRDNWRCVYCGKNLKRVRPKMRTLDHLTPVIKGGTNDETNLVTCCKKCNDRKQDQHVNDFCRYKPEAFTRIFDAITKPIDRKLAKDILAGRIDAYSLKEL